MPATSFLDIQSDLTPGGSFQFTPIRLNQIFGGTLPDGPHTIHLQAIDTDSQSATPFDLSFTLDTQAPAVAIQQPSAGLTTNQNPTITGTVADATSSVTRLQAQLDGGAYADESFTASGAFTFTLPAADGTHAINIKSQDLAGNMSSPFSTSFTLDTKPPTILITKPTASLTTNANVTIEGQVADIGTGVTTLTAAVDGGTATGELRLHRQLQPRHKPSPGWDGRRDAFAHVPRQRPGGNAAAPATVTFTLDATAPVVVITSPVDGSLTKVNVTVSGRSTDNLSGVAKLEAQVDTGVFVPVSFDTTGAYSFATQLPGDGTADGTHTVNLRATDQAGNVSTLTGVSFVLDTTPPAVTIVLDPSTDSAPVGDDQTTFEP